MTTEELKEYYANLLIMQYNQKPKARGTIKALAGAAIADNIEYQVRNGFNIATAVGKQLDILGGLIGASRVLPVALPARTYFETVDSDSVSTSLHGFADTDDAEAAYWYFYGALATSSLWSMDDDTYRKFIKYTAKFNSAQMYLSGQYLADGSYEQGGLVVLFNYLKTLCNSTTFFGMSDNDTPCTITGVGTVTPGNMQVVIYIYQNGVTDYLMKAIVASKKLPVPAGVEVLLYIDSVLTAY